MSQKNYELIQGIMQAAADAYDGALDEKGEPLKIGLKREEGHPVYDSRMIDGFKVRCDGTHLMVTYQSEIKLRDVYATKLEDELESTFSDIVSYLKKRYNALTGKRLSLSPTGECDALVQKTSNVRVFVVAKKVYRIGGLSGVENRLSPSKNNLDAAFNDFLAQGGSGGR
tara:strand:+ start:7214 stop:7723 length:510 start_codon:yes stop_codon:yes gene_type:complete